MSGQALSAWDYVRNYEGNFFISAQCDEHQRFPKIVLAEVFTEHAEDPEFNARLIAASPEMRIALIGIVEVLRATEVFMAEQGLMPEHLDEIVEVIDELLDRIDGV